jgi:CRISPR-associated protein Csm3
MKLEQVIRMDFDIVVVDGLRIGGGGGDLEVGGAVDANLSAIRDPISEEPYIPGSSLKGKLRSILEKIDKTWVWDKRHERLSEQTHQPCGCGRKGCLICTLFGAHMNTKTECAPTRLTVRDAHLAKKSSEELRAGGYLFEQKTESINNRKTGAAEKPRTGERVPPGARFSAHIVLRLYDADRGQVEAYQKAIEQALGLLQDADSLGASGTRGYGQVRIEDACVRVKKVAEFGVAFTPCAK